MDNRVNELNQYGFVEGVEFDGLMPKVMEKLGMTTGASDKSIHWFGFDGKGGESLEVVDQEEIMNESSEGGNQGGEGGNQGGEGGNQGGEGGNQGGEGGNQGGEGGNQGGEGGNQGGEGGNQGGEGGNQGGEGGNQGGEGGNQGGEGGNQGGEGGDQGGEGGSTEVDAEWEYICNEATWNAAYTGETMQAYYTWADETGSYPYKEDLWNEAEQRAANWNDIPKDQSGNPIETDHGYEYFDSLGNPCVRCWLGAINAPGAKYPWCVVTLPKPFTGTIKFVYDGGNPVYPWGENVRTFNNGFAVASIPTELGDEYLLDSNGNTTFDQSKLVVTLISE